MGDIYNIKKRLDRTIERIKESDEISDENRRTILSFARDLSVQDISLHRRERQLGIIFNIIKQNNLDLQNATEDELKDVVDWIQTNYSSAQTRQTMKLTLRKIYQSIDKLTEKGASPKKLKWMKTSIKKSNKKRPEDMFTIEEVKSMIKFAPSLRDKALIFVLYESGIRVGELGGLRIKDIAFDEYGARIQVSGKTGSRTLRVVLSKPYLLDWVNKHPTSEDTDSYMWISSTGRQLCYARLSKIIRHAANKAGIKKGIHPHNFRHSRATEMSRFLSASQLNNYFGWESGSTTAGIYIHLGGKDNDDPILNMYGIKKEEDKGDLLENTKCLRCGNTNKFTDVHCSHCGAVLNREVADEMIRKEQNRSDMDNFMNTIIKDPEIQELIRKKLASQVLPSSQQ